MIVPLTIEDAVNVCAYMRPSDWREIQELSYFENRNDYARARFEGEGVAFSVALEAGRPACIGGLANAGPGNMAAWLVGTNEMPRVAGWAWRFAMQRLVPAAFGQGIQRVQCLVMEGNDIAIRYAVKFGFEFEGVMRRLGRSGVNFHSYSLINEAA